jgi:hypothetical protein
VQDLSSHWWELGIVVTTALFGVVAWLYQTALARQEKRVAQYAAIIDSLQGFMVGSESPDLKNKAITASRNLWVIAPIAVIRAGNKFYEAAKGSGTAAEIALKEYILEMRRDTSLMAVMRFWRQGSLTAADIQLHSAK